MFFHETFQKLFHLLVSLSNLVTAYPITFGNRVFTTESHLIMCNRLEYGNRVS